MSAVIDSLYHWMDSPSPNRQSAILWWEELRRLKRGDEKGERGSSWGGRGEGGVGVLLVNHFSARAHAHDKRNVSCGTTKPDLVRSIVWWKI